MRFVCFALIVAMAVIVGCGGGAAVQRAAQPVKLAFGEAGNEYLPYKADFGINNNVEGSVRSWLSTIDFTAKVALMNDEGIERRFEFKEFTVTRVSQGRPDPDPNAPEYAGATLWLKTGPAGEILDWKGLDGVGGRTTDARRFKEYIVYQLVSMFQPPPDEAVNSGSTWHTEFEMELVSGAVRANYVTKLDYTVEGFGVRDGRECAKINVALAIDADGTGSMGGKETWFESREAGTGTIWFDHTSGIIVEYGAKTTADQETRSERVGKEDITTMNATVDSEVKIRLDLKG
jgi:hypothetical protein